MAEESLSLRRYGVETNGKVRRNKQDCFSGLFLVPISDLEFLTRGFLSVCIIHVIWAI